MSNREWLTSAWHPLALSAEVTRKQPLGRRCHGRDYVLFRDADDAVRVLDDRCAHRRAPLSLGRMARGGQIRCPYHGWTFEGRTGRCVAIPNLAEHETVPGRYEVRSHVAAEHLGIVFVWGGETGTADESLLPALALTARSVDAEGESLLTIPWRHFINTLLDGPSLILRQQGISVLDDHLLGYPRRESGMYICERAATWPVKARRRRLAPEEYPLVLRSSLDNPSGVAGLEIMDNDNRRLCWLVLAPVQVTAGVTAVYWRFRKTYRQYKSLAPGIVKKCRAIELAVGDSIDARKMLGLRPYVSVFRAGALNIHRSVDAPLDEGSA